jgi:hypothetical protein
VNIDTLPADHPSCYGDEQTETRALDTAKDSVSLTPLLPARFPILHSLLILTGYCPAPMVSWILGSLWLRTHTTWQNCSCQGYRTAALIGVLTMDSSILPRSQIGEFYFYDNSTRGDLPACGAIISRDSPASLDALTLRQGPRRQRKARRPARRGDSSGMNPRYHGFRLPDRTNQCHVSGSLRF